MVDTEEVSTTIDTVVDTNTITYRILPTEELARLTPLLSYCFPGNTDTFAINPETQAVVVAEDSARDNGIVAAVIVSSVVQLTYLMPIESDTRVDILQSVAESLLVPETLYYVLAPAGEESDALVADLSLTPLPGLVVHTKTVATSVVEPQSE